MPVQIAVVTGAGATGANGNYLRTTLEANNTQSVSQVVYVKDEPNGEWSICRRDRLWVILNPGKAPVYVADNRDGVLPQTGWREPSTNFSAPPKIQTISIPTYSLVSGKRHCDTIMEIVWKKRKFTDAVVICEGVTFDVHRATLSAASAVFETGFESTMQEGRSANFEIRESTPAAVENLLRFIYTGSVEVGDPDLVSLINLSVQYEIDGLVEIVASKLVEGLTVDNVQERAAVLKLHRAKVEGKWNELLMKLQSDKALLEAVVPGM